MISDKNNSSILALLGAKPNMLC